MVRHAQTGGIHTVQHSFTGGTDGGHPYCRVTLYPQGDLFGAAVIGGRGGQCPEDGCGVAYELTPSGGTWSQHVIHNFDGTRDGYGPGQGLTRGSDGSLYGMTPTGGADGLGVIYRLRPTATGRWSRQVLHTFTGGSDGGTGSAGRLLLDAAGNLYGVATVGGANGAGTAFELSPTAGRRWTFTTLYAFNGTPDAGFPYGGLVFDAAGNLYGTTYYAGSQDLGAVYELSPSAHGWTETVLHSFVGGTDGSGPISTLVFDAAGSMYGTTSEGGDPGCGCGTIFRLRPTAGGSWTERVVYRFAGPPDGAFAYNGMVADGGGNFFGTTVHGGTGNDGAAYEFTP